MSAYESTGALMVRSVVPKTDLVDLRTVDLPLRRLLVVDFDPRNHRKPQVVIKPWMAYLNLMRAAVGIGMLGAPLAMSRAGMLTGPFLVLFIGCLLIHTHLMLLSCLNEICRQLRVPYVPYRYGARLALRHGPPLMHGLGNWSPATIALFMFLSQLGICTVRIIFVADNLRDMFDAADSSTSLKFMIIPTLLLEVLMHNIRIISYIINGANAINIVGIILVIVQIFRGPRREIHLFPLGWVSVLVSIGTYLFNLCAVGVVLSCEKALEDPHIMSSPFGVVPVGLMVPTLINILIGTLGYWAYGVMDENILKYMAFDDPVTMAAHGLFSVSAIMGYPIFCYPGVQIIIEVIVNHDRNINIQPQSLKEVEFFARPIFVLLTFAIAYFKPYQGSLIAFVGCGCTSVLLLVLPALMEICLYYPNNYGRYHYILLKDLLIVAIGMVIWVGGLYTWAYLWYVSHSKFTEDTGMRFYLISE